MKREAKLHEKEEKLHAATERLHKKDEAMHKKIKKEHRSEEKHEKKEHHSKKGHDPKPKKVTIFKGKKVARGVESKMRKKPGSSSVGRYKTVAKKDFAGPKGGSAAGSFPIHDLKHARNALARAHFAPNPSGIRAAVYKKYPQLKIRAEKRHKAAK